MKYELVQCCPVPQQLAPVVKEVINRSGLRLNSCYRGQDARPLLAQCGKKDQAYLYWGWMNKLPGFNPANPPGRSTHECRNDGVAYSGWVGMPLRWWQVGMDWSYGAGAVRVFNSLGYSAALTYPNSPREGQHVNLRRQPRVSIWKYSPLKKGMRSRRVKRVKWQLHVIKDPHTGRAYFRPNIPETGFSTFFNNELKDAVKAFQRDHDQAVDGIVGFQTKHQLNVSYRKAQQKKIRARKRKQLR